MRGNAFKTIDAAVPCGEEGGGDLRAAVEKMGTVAAEHGIDGKGPLGVFIKSLMWVMVKLGDLVERFEESLGQHLDTAKKNQRDRTCEDSRDEQVGAACN